MKPEVDLCKHMHTRVITIRQWCRNKKETLIDPDVVTHTAISALEMRRQGNLTQVRPPVCSKFETILGYTRPCLPKDMKEIPTERTYSNRLPAYPEGGIGSRGQGLSGFFKSLQSRSRYA